MSELKTKVNRASVEKFLSTIQDAEKREDCIAISAMMEKATKAKPEMWGETGMGPRRKAGGATALSRGRPNFQEKIIARPEEDVCSGIV